MACILYVRLSLHPGRPRNSMLPSAAFVCERKRKRPLSACSVHVKKLIILMQKGNPAKVTFCSSNPITVGHRGLYLGFSSEWNTTVLQHETVIARIKAPLVPVATYVHTWFIHGDADITAAVLLSPTCEMSLIWWIWRSNAATALL